MIRSSENRTALLYREYFGNCPVVTRVSRASAADTAAATVARHELSPLSNHFSPIFPPQERILAFVPAASASLMSPLRL